MKMALIFCRIDLLAQAGVTEGKKKCNYAMIHFGIGVILSVGIKVDTKLYGGVWLDENLPWSSFPKAA